MLGTVTNAGKGERQLCVRAEKGVNLGENRT